MKNGRDNNGLIKLPGGYILSTYQGEWFLETPVHYTMRFSSEDAARERYQTSYHGDLRRQCRKFAEDLHTFMALLPDDVALREAVRESVKDIQQTCVRLLGAAE